MAPILLHVWPDWKCNMAAAAEFSWDRQTGQLPSEQPTTTALTALDCTAGQSRARYKHSRSFPGGGNLPNTGNDDYYIIITNLLESRTFRNKYTD